MKNSDSNKRIIQALIETLKLRIPPKNQSECLDDVVTMLMEYLSRGEVYIDLNKSYQHIEMKEKGWPELHVKELQESSWLDGKESPIVLKNNQLSWRRWHEEMNNIIDILLKKSLLKPRYNIHKSIENIDNLLLQLNAEQALAVDAVANHNLILLSGGPGTGKTTTIISMIVKAFSIKDNLNIGLCAPTGKASRRLEEALKKSLSHLNSKYRKKLSTIPCLTIHSWLQANEKGFIKNKSKPLELDLLVVDEMSMVDFSLMKGLLNALNQESQLILVGDNNQLPPIGIGPIWHELQKEPQHKKFNHCSINLSQIYRSKGELASLSQIVRSKELNEFINEANKVSSSGNVSIIYSDKEKIPNKVIETIHIQQTLLKDLIKALKSVIKPELMLLDSPNAKNAADNIMTCLEKLIVLCPRRYGYWSVDHIHKTLLGEDFKSNATNWPEGTPVMCCSNQSNIKLSNGDVGIIIEGLYSKYLLFRINSPGRSVNCQLITPARVKIIEPAFAITIHKAQGSESEHVMCLWPDAITKQSSTRKDFSEDDYNKRLIYTAITRAKEKLDLAITIKN